MFQDLLAAFKENIGSGIANYRTQSRIDSKSRGEQAAYLRRSGQNKIGAPVKIWFKNPAVPVSFVVTFGQWPAGNVKLNLF